MIVVDASVAAKWFWEESGSDEAAKLLSGPRRLVGPDLLRVEAAAAVTRRMRLGQLSADETRRICKDWFEAVVSDNSASRFAPPLRYAAR